MIADVGVSEAVDTFALVLGDVEVSCDASGDVGDGSSCGGCGSVA